MNQVFLINYILCSVLAILPNKYKTWLQKWVKNQSLKKSGNRSVQEISRSKFTLCCSIPLWLCDFVLKKIFCHFQWERQESRWARPLNFSLQHCRKGAVSLTALCSPIFFCFLTCFSVFAFHSDLGALFRQTFPCEWFQFQQIAILWHPAKWVPWKIPNHL